MYVGEEGSDGHAEGELGFVGEVEGEDVPGSTVADHLVLEVDVASLCSVLVLHLSLLSHYYYSSPKSPPHQPLPPTTTPTHHHTHPPTNAIILPVSKEGGWSGLGWLLV